jgi:hypothetical protein
MKSKIIIATLFFFIGFFTHLTLSKFNLTIEHSDRVEVKPEEFDRDMLHGGRPFLDSSEEIEQAFDLNIKETEDRDYVYYAIPIESEGKNSKLNVEVKDGYIHITHEAKDEGFSASSEQVFPVAPNLDETKAEVLNEKNKIIIKIPKKVK